MNRKRLLMPEPRWMKLSQAAAYSNIGEHRLLELAKDGLVLGFRDPDTKRQDWIFDRLSLDSYREGQGASRDAGNIKRKAVALLKEMRQ